MGFMLILVYCTVALVLYQILLIGRRFLMGFILILVYCTVVLVLYQILLIGRRSSIGFYIDPCLLHCSLGFVSDSIDW